MAPPWYGSFPIVNLRSAPRLSVLRTSSNVLMAPRWSEFRPIVNLRSVLRLSVLQTSSNVGMALRWSEFLPSVNLRSAQNLHRPLIRPLLRPRIARPSPRNRLPNPPQCPLRRALPNPPPRLPSSLRYHPPNQELRSPPLLPVPSPRVNPRLAQASIPAPSPVLALA